VTSSYGDVPGLVETREAFEETTLVVDPARLLDACLTLRDEHGFNLLSDVTPTDYLGWGEVGTAGYIGTASGRDLNEPAAQGYARTPEPKPKRFSVSYHLLRVSDDPARVRWRSGRGPTGSSGRPGT
jgi:NADH-quinone oxidoreductase subunit C